MSEKEELQCGNIRRKCWAAASEILCMEGAIQLCCSEKNRSLLYPSCLSLEIETPEVRKGSGDSGQGFLGRAVR